MTDPAPTPPTPRQRWMAILARASGPELAAAAAPILPAYTKLRGPELGLVMLQGRAGSTGAAFNLGEATVARCTVRDDAGRIGHAYCLGQDLQHAELAAALDAALQDPARHDAVQQTVITPLATAQQAARDIQSRRAAATQVQFFTMSTMRA